MEVSGITYKNTYYLDKNYANDLRLHFHELVHVAQWNLIGARNFITRYIEEILSYGYNDAPLENMAYNLDNYYHQGGKPIDILGYVQSKM